jgi:cytochrome c-type biogenesis protein CcmF
MTLAHAGLGVAIAGMIGSSLWVEGNAGIMKPGEVMKVGGYTLTLQKVEPVFGENYSSAMAFVDVARDGGKPFAVMKPERRHFPVAGQTTTEAAIRQSLHDDLYVTLGERDTNGGWIVRAWTHPLVPYLWIGYMMIALGGLLGAGGRLCRKSY